MQLFYSTWPNHQYKLGKARLLIMVRICHLVSSYTHNPYTYHIHSSTNPNNHSPLLKRSLKVHPLEGTGHRSSLRVARCHTFSHIPDSLSFRYRVGRSDVALEMLLSFGNRDCDPVRALRVQAAPLHYDLNLWWIFTHRPFTSHLAHKCLTVR